MILMVSNINKNSYIKKKTFCGTPSFLLFSSSVYMFIDFVRHLVFFSDFFGRIIAIFFHFMYNYITSTLIYIKHPINSLSQPILGSI